MNTLKILCVVASLGFRDVLGCSSSDTLPRSAECFSSGTEYHGGGLPDPMVSGIVSAQECQGLCQFREGCNFFTWINNVHDTEFYRNSCWLKESQGSPQECPNCVSGPRVCEDNNTCCTQVSISSSGLTPDFQWTRLGSYVLQGTSPDGRPYYEQINVNNPNYLYYLEWLGVWYVNDELLVNMGGMINWGDAWCPADLQETWSFYRWDEVNDWYEDPSLVVSCESFVPPTTTTTRKPTTTTRAPATSTTTRNPSSACNSGIDCMGCDVWTEHNGVAYCCAANCDYEDVFVWEENGEVHCTC